MQGADNRFGLLGMQAYHMLASTTTPSINPENHLAIARERTGNCESLIGGLHDLRRDAAHDLGGLAHSLLGRNRPALASVALMTAMSRAVTVTEH